MSPASGAERAARAGARASARGALTLAGISKRFPGVQALAGVSFAIEPGEVHALVGENGAGKSTLLKILSGAHRPDEGEVAIGGVPLTLDTPRDARAAGIAVIYQELSLVPWLTVAQNLFLGREERIGRVLFSARRLRAEAARALARVGADLDPDTPVAHLGVAAQQMVEIARALGDDARFLLMDEPTAALSERETDALLATIRGLREARVGIAYISHRLGEIPRVADRVTVLRDGRVVLAAPQAALGAGEMIAAMVGRAVADHYPARTPGTGPEVLRVDPPPDRPRSRTVTVRGGEVVGLAGLVGAGRTEWAWRVVGAAPPIGERVRLHGRLVVIRSPRQARAAGIGMVPENRKEHGLVLGMSVRENLTLTVLDRLARWLGVVDRRAQAALARRFVERLAIRCPGDRVLASTLSGGNQQKVVLAKWLARDSAVLVLDEPTRGIDVGAKAEMYALVNELSRGGKALVLISSDLPELLAMSDRVYVVHAGDVVAELDARRAGQEEVLHYASGVFEHAPR